MTPLTSVQQQVVDEDGHCLVVAGPGAGKTSTMVAKIKKTLQDPNAKIVAVTFTRDAAAELRRRLSALRRDQAQRLKIGTFHSLTIRHLSELGHSYNIASPVQQRSYLKRSVDQFDRESDFSVVQQKFEAVKCTMDPTPATKEIEKSPWFTAYTRLLESLGMVDLYDVMQQTAVGFRDGKVPPLPCTHLIVDEAQDNDEVQFAWVRAHKGSVITIVGDDDQTIYEWRRAVGFVGMMSFREERRANVYVLEQNFRSKEEIVVASRALIERNAPYRNDKRLQSMRGVGGKVAVLETDSFEAQCELASRTILDDSSSHIVESQKGELQLVQVQTGSWAVLARTNAMLISMEARLSQVGIKSFRSTGSLWEHHVAQAFLHTILAVHTFRPESVDASLAYCGIPNASIECLLAAHQKDMSKLFVSPDISGLSGDLEETVSLLSLFARWRRFVESNRRQILLEQISNFVASRLRKRDRKLGDVVLQYANSRVSSSANSLEQTVSAMLMENSKKSADNSVVLHTMHGAKGLEFRNVIVLGVDDKVMPGDSALDLSPTDPLVTSGATTVASERRLLYVAMTRAKDRLLILHSRGEGSRFLSDFAGQV